MMRLCLVASCIVLFCGCSEAQTIADRREYVCVFTAANATGVGAEMVHLTGNSVYFQDGNELFYLDFDECEFSERSEVWQALGVDSSADPAFNFDSEKSDSLSNSIALYRNTYDFIPINFEKAFHLSVEACTIAMRFESERQADDGLLRYRLAGGFLRFGIIEALRLNTTIYATSFLGCGDDERVGFARRVADALGIEYLEISGVSRHPQRRSN